MKVLSLLLLTAIIILAVFLRFYKISEIPHGLYIDEVSIGYNAFTILQNGKDEYGTPFPVFFKAFGEYKSPVYIYLTSLSMKIFGKTEFAVRFPSAFLGSATILIFYLFLKTLFSLNAKIFLNKTKESASLIGALLLAISPWNIQFSRAGFEANVALFFYLLGIWLFLLFYRNKNMAFLFLGSLALILTLYTYNAYRLITPVTLAVSYLYLYFISTRSNKKYMAISALITIFLSLPLFLFAFSQNGMNRFSETSAFSQYTHISTLQQLFYFPLIYLKNYLSYFAFTYLFVSGDGFGRHMVASMGPFFRWEIIPLILGSYYLIKNFPSRLAKATLLLLIISPTAAALTIPSPHLLRSLQMVIPITIIITLGIIYILQKQTKWKYIIIAFILFAAGFEFAQYLHLYYAHYPMLTALDWGAQDKQLILAAAKQQKNYDYIVIDQNIGPLTEYIKFYDDKLSYMLVNNSWKKPEAWKNKKTLYIAPNNIKQKEYLQTIPHKHIEDIRLPNLNHDIMAQFWEI